MNLKKQYKIAQDVAEILASCDGFVKEGDFNHHSVSDTPRSLRERQYFGCAVRIMRYLGYDIDGAINEVRNTNNKGIVKWK